MANNEQSPVPLDQALGVTLLKPNTYSAYMHPHHGHGGSAHGGFCMSQIQCALKHYFNSNEHLSKLDQPDTYCVNLVFLARVPDGEATIHIQDVALGRTNSTVHVAIQYGDKDRIVGYASQTKLGRSLGRTFHISTPLSPEPAAADFEKMSRNTDPYWIRFTYPWAWKSLTKNFLHAERWTPRYPHPPNMQEYWFRMLPRGLRITTEMLGSLIDNYARTPENWRPGSPGSHAGMLSQGYHQQQTGEELIKDPSFADGVGAQTSATPQGHGSARTVSLELDDENMARQALAYPTVMMNMEIKKRLPEEGVEWLYCRATTKSIRGGRVDADVVLMDQVGEVVSTSHQVGYMWDMSGDVTKSRAAGRSKL